MRRWLADDALNPWQQRSWIFITDPDFRIKPERALGLYARTWQGVPLGEDEYVISADEKTSIQARCRCHPTLAPGQARAMRVNLVPPNDFTDLAQVRDRLRTFEDRYGLRKSGPRDRRR
ncbi:hypothetical protein ACH4U7_40410 [Streptomyces sp. NPDC020845]|uniref:hypothetical protein n=1 Tax=Streptomyces sp. NPDC020845 TaxID=3365096 RepID=UPI0037A31C8B